MYTIGILLSLISLLFQLPAEEQLQQRVEGYWQAMEKKDKYGALEYVLPDARNAFIQRREFVFRNWKVEEIRPVANEVKAHVILSVERLMEQSGTFYQAPIRQTWVYQDDRWYLSVPQLGSRQVHELLYGLNRKVDHVVEGEVSVAPDMLKMSFLNPVQRAAIVIRNGLEEPLRLVGVTVDSSRFEIEELPESISSGTETTIYLRYTGSEDEKDLQSRATVVLEDKDGQRREYPIQILYNHISETTKAFFGLTDEQARQLKKGEKLTPRLRTPPNAGKAPPSLPEELLEPDSDDPPPDR